MPLDFRDVPASGALFFGQSDDAFYLAPHGDPGLQFRLAGGFFFFRLLPAHDGHISHIVAVIPGAGRGQGTGYQALIFADHVDMAGVLGVVGILDFCPHGQLRAALREIPQAVTHDSLSGELAGRPGQGAAVELVRVHVQQGALALVCEPLPKLSRGVGRVHGQVANVGQHAALVKRDNRMYHDGRVLVQGQDGLLPVVRGPPLSHIVPDDAAPPEHGLVTVLYQVHRPLHQGLFLGAERWKRLPVDAVADAQLVDSVPHELAAPVADDFRWQAPAGPVGGRQVYPIGRAIGRLVPGGVGDAGHQGSLPRVQTDIHSGDEAAGRVDGQIDVGPAYDLAPVPLGDQVYVPLGLVHLIAPHTLPVLHGGAVQGPVVALVGGQALPGNLLLRVAAEVPEVIQSEAAPGWYLVRQDALVGVVFENI